MLLALTVFLAILFDELSQVYCSIFITLIEKVLREKLINLFLKKKNYNQTSLELLITYSARGGLGFASKCL